MASTPLAFYRGTNHLYWADISGGWADCIGAERLQQFGLRDAGTRTWLKGDLHPYNYGAFSPDVVRSTIWKRRLRTVIEDCCSAKIYPPATSVMTMRGGCLITSMRLPIVGKLEDGNASDKTINHRFLGEVSRHIQVHGIEDDAFIDIADSAMVTKANLAQAERTHFITRLPATDSEHERVILSAIEADAWNSIGTIAQTPATKHRRGAS